MTGWESTSQIELEIKTVPADADPYALRIARQIASWLNDAGIDAEVTPMAGEELLRQVLMQNDFDLFVARIPDRFRLPDAFYSLLHSQFADAPGWQNPFGYTDLDVDDLLETQSQTTGAVRREAVDQLQRTVARSQPFTVLTFPDDIRASRSDRFVNWRSVDLRSPLGYLGLQRANDGVPDRQADGNTTPTDQPGRSVLRMVVTDDRPTENLNPLAVEYRRDGLVTGLLYDSLGYESSDGTIQPWMAESWWFQDAGERPRMTVRLRSDCTWHDGEALTADDVAFTYAFLADTSMGAAEPSDEEEGPIPAPRFQGRVRLVESVTSVDDTTVEFQFVDCDPGVATRALTAPILPQHVWEDRTETASVGGIQIGPATDALVTSNIPAVGNGPFRFARHTPGETLVLDRFEDHFLSTGDPETLPPGMTRRPDFDQLSIRAVGSDEAAIELVGDGDADVTGTAVGADTVPRIGRESDTELLVDRSTSPFLVGYNTRRPPLANPRFRNTMARLIDQSWLVDEIFEGYATPAASLLAGTVWLPDDLDWNGENPIVPFLGADGELDDEQVRETFRAAGYQYDDGKLVGGH